MTTDKSGRTSAGILLWRSRKGRLEVLLAHQGGPFWVKKDIGHWTIPKGEVEPGEEFVAVARREFAEETGHQAPNDPLIDLGQITQKSGKLVLGWALQGDLFDEERPRTGRWAGARRLAPRCRLPLARVQPGRPLQPGRQAEAARSSRLTRNS